MASPMEHLPHNDEVRKKRGVVLQLQDKGLFLQWESCADRRLDPSTDITNKSISSTQEGILFLVHNNFQYPAL